MRCDAIVAWSCVACRSSYSPSFWPLARFQPHCIFSLLCASYGWISNKVRLKHDYWLCSIRSMPSLGTSRRQTVDGDIRDQPVEASSDLPKLHFLKLQLFALCSTTPLHWFSNGVPGWFQEALAALWQGVPVAWSLHPQSILLRCKMRLRAFWCLIISFHVPSYEFNVNQANSWRNQRLATKRELWRKPTEDHKVKVSRPREPVSFHVTLSDI